MTHYRPPVTVCDTIALLLVSHGESVTVSFNFSPAGADHRMGLRVMCNDWLCPPPPPSRQRNYHPHTAWELTPGQAGRAPLVTAAPWWAGIGQHTLSVHWWHLGLPRPAVTANMVTQRPSSPGARPDDTDIRHHHPDTGVTWPVNTFCLRRLSLGKIKAF